MFLNRRHAKKREEMGKTAEIVDESMMRNKNMEESKAVELEEDAGAGHQTRAVEEDNGLLDMTDLRNEDFIYVY